MRRLILITIVALLLATPAWAANLIYSQDFEEPGLELSDVFYTSYTQAPDVPDYSVSIITEADGNRCIRGNVYTNSPDSDWVDPITGKPAWLSPKLNIGGSTDGPYAGGWGTCHNFRDLHTGELYIRWKMKIDDSANMLRGPYDSNGAFKLMYPSDTGGVNTHYMNRYNNRWSFYGNYFHEGANTVYGASPVNTGEWVTYEAYFKYASELGCPDGEWRFYENGELVFDHTMIDADDGYLDGQVNIRSVEEGKITVLRFIHFTFGSNGPCGYQIDDIEIWDGLPDEEPPAEYSGDLTTWFENDRGVSQDGSIVKGEPLNLRVKYINQRDVGEFDFYSYLYKLNDQEEYVPVGEGAFKSKENALFDADRPQASISIPLSTNVSLGQYKITTEAIAPDSTVVDTSEIYLEITGN